MKPLFIIFILLFSIKSNAQVVETPNKDGMIDNIKTVKPQTLNETFPQAKLLFGTGDTKIYSLPMDNMPCIVPFINSNMPVRRVDMNQFRKIPNALPEFKLIPQIETPKEIPGVKNKNPLN